MHPILINGNSGYLYYYTVKASLFWALLVFVLYSALCKAQKNFLFSHWSSSSFWLRQLAAL